MTLLIVYVAIALGFSFLCSVLEAVLLSVGPAYLAKIKEEDPKLGEKLSALKADLDRPLAAILSLNTIAHTVGAAGAGAQAQALWGSDILTVASAVLTLLILVVSEIIPKTLGAVHYKRLAPFAASVLPLLILMLLPLVWLSKQITRLISAKSSAHGGGVDREEIAALAQMGAEEGLFDANESRVLRVLFTLKDVRASDIMTPRSVVASCLEEATVKSVIGEENLLRFSRIPLWAENRDHITGYVLKDEILLAAARDEHDAQLSKFRRNILMVRPGCSVPELLEKFLEKKEHIAMVVDRFGGVSGVVTMEDVVETLLGTEIVDEVDAVEDMRQLARRRWFERARRLGLASSETLEALERSN